MVVVKAKAEGKVRVCYVSVIIVLRCKYICKHRMKSNCVKVFCVLNTVRRYPTWSIINWESPSFRSDRFKRRSRKHAYIYNFDPLKPHFYIVKLGVTGVNIIFLLLLKNKDCRYSLEPPRRGGSNEYPQSRF